MTPSRAELLKWVGLASMLIDHAARFLHVGVPGWLWLGRCAFPCFAVALGVQVVPVARLRVGVRLLFAALCVFPFQWYGSRVPVVSVLATLGLGLLVADVIDVAVRAGRAWASRWSDAGALVLLAFLASLFVEYGVPGVLLVAAASLLSGADDDVFAGAVCLGAAVVGLVFRAGVLGAPETAAGLALVGAYVVSDGVVVPRVRGLFLKSYFAQWGVLCAARLLS